MKTKRHTEDRAIGGKIQKAASGREEKEKVKAIVLFLAAGPPWRMGAKWWNA